MRLIEDESSVTRQDPASRRGRLGEDKRVVDDDEMRLRRRLARLVDEAFRIKGTPPAAALLAGTRENIPRQPFVRIEITIRRRLKPLDERRHQPLFLGGHRPEPRSEELTHSPEAEVVTATLQQGDLETRWRWR